MSLDRQVAIIGAAGMLGHALRKVFPEAALFDKVPSADGRIQFIDITKKESIWSALSKLGEDAYVINAAAYTDVDGAETLEGTEKSCQINCHGAMNLSGVSAGLMQRCVHFSTAYIFDGNKGSPYKETDKHKPLSQYGAHKLVGDLGVIVGGGIVLRTDNLFGPNGEKNLVDRIVANAREHKTIPGVTDQFGSPTLTTTLARITRQVIERWEKTPNMTRQIYHATSGNGCSRAELAREIVKMLGVDCQVEEMTTAEYNARYRAGKVTAIRPRDCRLDTTKLNEIGIETPDWRNEVEEYVRHYFSDKKADIPAGWKQ